MRQVEAGIFKLAGERIVGIGVLPCADEAGQAIQSFRIEGKHFADFARGGFSAIGDHIRGHRCAEFSVTFIDILNGTFTLVAAREIQIDVRPFAAFLRKKTLKK